MKFDMFNCPSSLIITKLSKSISANEDNTLFITKHQQLLNSVREMLSKDTMNDTEYKSLLLILHKMGRKNKRNNKNDEN